MRLAIAVEFLRLAVFDVMVAGMEVAFVDHGKSLGRKCLRELHFHPRLYGHCSHPLPHVWRRHENCRPSDFSPDSAVRGDDREMSILVSQPRTPHKSGSMKAYSKYFEKIRIRPDKDAELKSHAPACQWDGCEEAGTHRAPVGRMKEGEYFHFCFNHVREYNKRFNYFSGLTDTDIARFQKEALTGHRPTWRIGVQGAARFSPDFADKRSGRASYYRAMRDPFNLFGEGYASAQPRERKARRLGAKALETLGLDAKATGADIKARYKQLVKRHHPDSNGGDRGSEDRFRDVLQAY